MLKGVIFDLDGTLLDSSVGITESLRYAERKLALQPVPEGELLKYVGMPIKPMLGFMYGVKGEEIDTVLAAYREHYSGKGHKKVTPFQGVAGMLMKLKNAGLGLAIATSKREGFTRANLTDCGLIGYFDALSFAQPDDSSIDKIDIVKNAVKLLHLKPEECLMVGDKIFDVEGAKGAGTRSMGVTYGFGGVDEIRDAGPDYTAHSPREATDIILKIHKGGT